MYKDTKIGIFIPLFNQESYIGEAIASAVCQDYPNLELAAVDDCSTDNSRQKVLDDMVDVEQKENYYCGRINGLVCHLLINETNKGVSFSRNKAIQFLLNRGCEYVGNLDADDQFLPNKISKCASILDDDPLVSLVYHDIVLYHDAQKTFSHEFREPFSRERLEQEDIINNMPLMRSRVIAEVGGYNCQMRTCEDYEFYTRMTVKNPATHIAEPLGIYRITGKNTSDTISKEEWNKNWAMVRQSIQQQRGA